MKPPSPRRRGRPPQPDDALLARIKAIIAEMPTYGYRRVHAILRRAAAAAGSPPAPNHKRVWRVMRDNGLLLQRHAGGEARRHDGRIAVDERNRRWCSDGFEVGCDNGERVERSDFRLPVAIHTSENSVLRRPVESAQYVLEGQIDFLLEGKRFRCGQGGFAFIARGSPDAFRNLSNVPARMLGVFSPTAIDGSFDAMVGQPLEALPSIAQRFGIEIIGPMIEPIEA
jgi:HTH-like domain